MTEPASDDKIKVAAHVVIQLGQELVTDVEQAFLELAKNAYDADAETCTFSIEPDWAFDASDKTYELLDQAVKASAKKRHNSAQKVGRVTVTDDGLGADESMIRDGWLTISASVKRSRNGPKTESAKGRTPVGDKGLGVAAD